MFAGAFFQTANSDERVFVSSQLHKNIKSFYETITTKLLKQWSFKIDGKTS